MSPAQTALLAVALAMDAFAVSFAAGVVLGSATWRQTFRLAWHFGLFQALMPLAGWGLGAGLAAWIAPVDHWVAFGLLALVGGRMLLDAWRGRDDEDQPRDPTRGLTLMVLAVATSIDALAVGLSLAVLNVPMLGPILAIGLTAVAFSALGIHLGRLLGARALLRRGAEAFGGAVLVGIGLKVLAEHGVFG